MIWRQLSDTDLHVGEQFRDSCGTLISKLILVAKHLDFMGRNMQSKCFT